MDVAYVNVHTTLPCQSYSRSCPPSPPPMSGPSFVAIRAKKMAVRQKIGHASGFVVAAVPGMDHLAVVVDQVACTRYATGASGRNPERFSPHCSETGRRSGSGPAESGTGQPERKAPTKNVASCWYPQSVIAQFGPGPVYFTLPLQFPQSDTALSCSGASGSVISAADARPAQRAKLQFVEISPAAALMSLHRS